MRERAPKPIRSAGQWLKLRPAEREARERALEALSLMRSQGLSLSRAAAEAGTTTSTARRYIGDALQRDRPGRFHARPGDRLFRRMQTLTTEGVREVDVRGSRVASTIARHWNAVKTYLHGNATTLERFAGKRVGGHELMTDLAAIEEEGRRGEVPFEHIYRL